MRETASRAASHEATDKEGTCHVLDYRPRRMDDGAPLAALRRRDGRDASSGCVRRGRDGDAPVRTLSTDPESRMTPREVARLAHVADETVYRAIHSRELPARRVGAGARTYFKVRRADAVAWMAGPDDEGEEAWT